MISNVTLPTAVWDQLLRHAAEAAPEECCGLLIGHPGEILEAVPTLNVAAEPVRRFQVDPAAHFAVIRRARAEGTEVIGAYHSHPAGPAVLSETDQAEAFDDPAFVHVLVLPRDQVVSAFLMISGNFVGVPLVRVP